MKKSFLAILCASATLAYADLTVTEANQSASGENKGDIIFTTDGAKLTAPGHIGATNIVVDSGVSATITTGSGSAVYLGTATDGSTISGAGKDVSELTFEGYIMGANPYGSAASNYALSIENITLNIKRGDIGASNNLLRGGPISITNSVINILASSKSSCIEPKITDTNDTTSDNFTITNSSFNVNSGATLLIQNLAGGNGNRIVKLDNSTMDISGTVNLGSAKINLANNSKLSISGSINPVSSDNNALVLTVEKGSSIVIEKTGYYNYGSAKNADSYINLSGSMTISGYAMVGRKIRMDANGSKLILNSSNLDANSGYQVNPEYMLSGAPAINISAQKVELEINAQNNLNLCITKQSNKDKTITITLGDRSEADYLLAMDYLIANPNSNNFHANNDLSSTGNIYYDFISFTDGDVVFATNTVTEEALKAALSHFKWNGKNIDWNYSIVEFDGVSYWAIAVPEPAEWAVIFGAVALTFVAYRRAKAKRA